MFNLQILLISSKGNMERSIENMDTDVWVWKV